MGYVGEVWKRRGRGRGSSSNRCDSERDGDGVRSPAYHAGRGRERDDITTLFVPSLHGCGTTGNGRPVNSPGSTRMAGYSSECVNSLFLSHSATTQHCSPHHPNQPCSPVQYRRQRLQRVVLALFSLYVLIRALPHASCVLRHRIEASRVLVGIMHPHHIDTLPALRWCVAAVARHSD